MKNPYLKLSLFLVILCSITSAHASFRDFTFDFEIEAASNEHAIFSPEIDPNDRDPWGAFLASIPILNQINLGVDLKGAAPLERDASSPMVPASVQKMVTAASAFRNLGNSARFENYFEAQYSNTSRTASRVKFTVSGDPTWGHSEYESFNARMDKVIAELKSKGITQVTGEVTVVSTRPELDQIPRPTGWPERWTLECMATLPSSFMMNGNCGSFKVTSLTHAQWNTPGVDLPIQLNLTAGNANHLSITAIQDSLKRVTGYGVSGTFKSPTSLGTVPVYFGTRWLKNLFIEALAANGIQYLASGTQVSGANLMVDLSSLPLKDVLQKGVQESINAILDRTYFEIAHVKNLTNGSDASYEVLREVVGDESLMNGVQIFDGCGLVVDDRMRADTLRQFLANLRNQPYFSDFLSVLAVSGKSGTLAHRLTGPLTNGKVFAKTGTIDQFYNLAGYFQTPSQTLEPFAIFTSSRQSVMSVRNMIDSLVTQFAKFNQ